MGPYLAQPNVQKITGKGDSFKNKLKFSLCEMQGLEVSKFVEKIFLTHLKGTKAFRDQKYGEALIETFRKVDEAIQSKEGEEELRVIRKKFDAASFNEGVISMGAGCTACVVLITPTKIYTANAGDSRAVLCRKGNAMPLSYDHKPQNQAERKRIQQAGGQISNGRVNGGLNLSRSFGDFNYKKQKQRSWDQQLIISKPDVTEVLRQPGDDEFIIMGCDGIWEKYVNDSQPLITRVHNERRLANDGLTILRGLLDSLLAKETSQEAGCDNMTAILIEFI